MSFEWFLTLRLDFPPRPGIQDRVIYKVEAQEVAVYVIDVNAHDDRRKRPDGQERLWKSSPDDRGFRLWDDQAYPDRKVAGFYSKDKLASLIRRIG